MMLRFVLATLMALALTPIIGNAEALAQSKTYLPVHAAADRLALGGHDPVAYFTRNQPVEGDAAITLDWNGATWRFATAEHRAMFEANPQAYAPQFGATALGRPVRAILRRAIRRYGASSKSVCI